MNSTSTWTVTDIQACEPEELTAPTDGVTVFVQPDMDWMGQPRVDVSGPSRDAVLEYIRANWGDDDAEWFDRYIVGRIVVR